MSRTSIYVSEMTHFFNPDEFKELGYQRSIALSETLVYPTFDKSQILYKFISQTTVELFDFSWIDTSSIQMLNFGKTLLNYKIEETQS